MRKIATISSVLLLNLIFLASGSIERGLVSRLSFQGEGIQETEIVNTRAQGYHLTPTTKQCELPINPKTETFAFFSSVLPKIITLEIVSFKNPLFIRYCSFLI
jgi:hypothetical protein